MCSSPGDVVLSISFINDGIGTVCEFGIGAGRTTDFFFFFCLLFWLSAFGFFGGPLYFQRCLGKFHCFLSSWKVLRRHLHGAGLGMGIIWAWARLRVVVFTNYQ
jgi:hypothetical protein